MNSFYIRMPQNPFKENISMIAILPLTMSKKISGEKQADANKKLRIDCQKDNTNT